MSLSNKALDAIAAATNSLSPEEYLVWFEERSIEIFQENLDKCMRGDGPAGMIPYWENYLAIYKRRLSLLTASDQSTEEYTEDEKN